jgi:hypothetical protein
MIKFYGSILFKGHRRIQEDDLQLVVLECIAYHNVLMNSKSQIGFYHLCQLYVKNRTKKTK